MVKRFITDIVVIFLVILYHNLHDYSFLHVYSQVTIYPALAIS